MIAILGEEGRGARYKVPVFGILERNGKVKVEVVKDVKAETLLKEEALFTQINLGVTMDL